jgi:hypothetical protein
MMSDEKTVHGLKLNCGSAYLLRDKSGVLDAYDSVILNFGNYIATPEIDAKLKAKGGRMNFGNSEIIPIKGEIVSLDGGAILDGGEDFSGRFVFVKGDLFIREGAGKTLETVEAVLAAGTVYYAKSLSLSSSPKVRGRKKAYPDGDWPMGGNFTLHEVLGMAPPEETKIFVSGELSAFDGDDFTAAGERKLHIDSGSLFASEPLAATHKEFFTAGKNELVPEGFMATGDLNMGSGEAALYGPKIYVRGDLTLQEQDGAALQGLEAVIVTGTVNLPASLAASFRKIGKAKDYKITGGNIHEINGAESLSHEQLAAVKAAGKKLDISVNGALFFGDDVTPDDMDAIGSLSYNGMVIISNEAKAGLAAKIKAANGLMGDPALIKMVTGESVEELVRRYREGRDSEDDGWTTVNVGEYILV